MKTFRASLFFFFFGLFFCAVGHAQLISIKTAQGKQVRATNQVLIRYKNGRRPNSVQALSTINKIGVDVVAVPPTESMDSFLKKLQSDPNVESAEPNVLVHMLFTPNDPHFKNQPVTQYYLNATHLNMEQAWDITQGSVTTVVAVVDTGVRLNPVPQPDIIANLWTDPNNPGVHGATMKIDWNGDGDCTDTDPDAGPEMCPNSTPNDDLAGIFHGTHVAGIIAATTNNGMDIAGICPNCQIMAVKVLNSEGFGSLDSIVSGIIFAVDSGANVINMSLGGPSSSPAEEAAVDYAIKHNVVVVAASGNDGAPCNINFPAAINSVISVGAVDSADNLAAFSCSGGALDVVAPGVDIISLSDSGTSSESGTSFATPMVAGLAGLVHSLNPNLTPLEVNRYINFNTDDLGAGGYDGVYGFGRINAFKTVTAVRNGTSYASNPGFPGETFPEPNPFHPLSGAPVRFSMPAAIAPATDKKITLMNISGEKVTTINCSGTCDWDGKNDAGNYVASGLYYYRVESSLGNAKGKITVIK